jgi:hypothetical protein
MEKSIEIIKSLLIPELEKDINYKNVTIQDLFWETFLQNFLDFENDSKFCYELIYGMQLNNPEIIFVKFPFIYYNLIKELAESHVQGFKDSSIDFLIINGNLEFQNEVTFLNKMQEVIKKVERKRIKSELPNSYERLTFKLRENTIKAVAKKKGREDLKEKFKKWDAELENEKSSVIFYSLEKEENKNEHNQKQNKSNVISLNWIKYAVAACLILGLGIWFFKFNTPEVLPSDNNLVTTKDKDSILDKKPELKTKPVEAIAYSIKTNKNDIQYPSDFGFTTDNNSKSIIVIIKNGSKSIEALEKKFSKTKIDSIRKQLILLKTQQRKYEFDGKKLIVYSSNMKLKTSILSINDKDFYIKKDNVYYYLYFTKLPQEFKEVKEEELLNQLEKISFENE